MTKKRLWVLAVFLVVGLTILSSDPTDTSVDKRLFRTKRSTGSGKTRTALKSVGATIKRGIKNTAEFLKKNLKKLKGKLRRFAKKVSKAVARAKDIFRKVKKSKFVKFMNSTVRTIWTELPQSVKDAAVDQVVGAYIMGGDYTIDFDPDADGLDGFDMEFDDFDEGFDDGDDFSLDEDDFEYDLGDYNDEDRILIQKTHDIVMRPSDTFKHCCCFKSGGDYKTIDEIEEGEDVEPVEEDVEEDLFDIEITDFDEESLNDGDIDYSDIKYSDDIDLSWDEEEFLNSIESNVGKRGLKSRHQDGEEDGKEGPKKLRRRKKPDANEEGAQKKFRRHKKPDVEEDEEVVEEEEAPRRRRRRRRPEGEKEEEVVEEEEPSRRRRRRRRPEGEEEEEEEEEEEVVEEEEPSRRRRRRRRPEGEEEEEVIEEEEPSRRRRRRRRPEGEEEEEEEVVEEEEPSRRRRRRRRPEGEEEEEIVEEEEPFRRRRRRRRPEGEEVEDIEEEEAPRRRKEPGHRRRRKHHDDEGDEEETLHEVVLNPKLGSKDRLCPCTQKALMKREILLAKNQSPDAMPSLSQLVKPVIAKELFKLGKIDNSDDLCGEAGDDKTDCIKMPGIRMGGIAAIVTIKLLCPVCEIRILDAGEKENKNLLGWRFQIQSTPTLDTFISQSFMSKPGTPGLYDGNKNLWQVIKDQERKEKFYWDVMTHL